MGCFWRQSVHWTSYQFYRSPARQDCGCAGGRSAQALIPPNPQSGCQSLITSARAPQKQGPTTPTMPRSCQGRVCFVGSQHAITVPKLLLHLLAMQICMTRPCWLSSCLAVWGYEREPGPQPWHRLLVWPWASSAVPPQPFSLLIVFAYPSRKYRASAFIL